MAEQVDSPAASAGQSIPARPRRLDQMLLDRSGRQGSPAVAVSDSAGQTHPQAESSPPIAAAVTTTPPAQAAAPVSVSEELHSFGLDFGVSSLVKAVLQQKTPASSQFYLVVVPETDRPKLITTKSVDELLAAIRLQPRAAYFFVFMGSRFSMTKGASRKLVTPFGSLPIDVETSEDSISDDGWMGEDPPITELMQLGVEQASAQLADVAAASPDEDPEPLDPDDDDGSSVLS